jgi:SAM-dependent methyltransferase
VETHGNDSFRHPDYAIHHCLQCDLYFKTQILDEATINRFYQVLPHETFEYHKLFPTDRLILRALQQLPEGSRVLDFGCSTGRILQHLTAKHACFGVEVNVRSAELARRRGVTILTESEALGSANGFDAIILSDVFEHLLHPMCLISSLAGVLSPRGRLILSTGNAEAVMRQDEIGAFWYFRILGHLQMATPAHMTWCAGQIGLEMASCEFASHYDSTPLAKSAQALKIWIYDRFHRHPSSPLTTVLRWIPKLNRAALWSSPPAYTFGQDHLVAVLRHTVSL